MAVKKVTAAPKRAKRAAKAPVPAAAPAAPAASGRRKTLTLILVSVLVLLGLGVQTWVMARNKAAMTFDLTRSGGVIPKGVSDGQLMGAVGLGCSENGALYVLDNISEEQPRLQKFDANNAFVAKFNPRKPSETFVQPRDLAVGKDGTLAVLKRDGGVRVLDKDLKFLSGFETGLSGTISITMDSQGRIFVSTNEANKIVIFDRTGKRLGEFGAPGTQTGDLSLPMRIRALSNDHIAVLEILSTGPRFKVFSPELALVKTFAASEISWSEAAQLAVTADRKAFLNDHLGDKGVVVFDLDKGKYVGNTKGSTSGDLFVSPGACGGGAWSDSIVIGAISGYTRALYTGPNKR